MNDNAVHIFNKYASAYAEKYRDISQYHTALDIFCDSIKKQNASVLELACGPGNITKYLLTKRPDFNILATDLAPEMLKITKAENPSIETQLLDCSAIASLNKNFDGIMCSFGLPYLSREEAIKLIKDAATVLSAGGALYLSTMEDDYSKSDWQTSTSGDKVYMYYHESGYLIKAFEENGLTLLYQSTLPPVNGFTDLLLIAIKQ